MSAPRNPRAAAAADFTVEARTELPKTDYAALAALAAENHTTISRLVRECVRRVLHEPTLAQGTPQATPGPVKSSRGPYVRLTAEHANVVRELYAEGLNDVEIARRLGASDYSARMMRVSLGLAPRPTGRPRIHFVPTPEEST